jgi:hypothetical protein
LRWSILYVLALASEGKLVLGLVIGDLVDTEPLVSGTQETRQASLNILDAVEVGSKSIIDVDDDDLPVGLTLIEKGHDAKNLDLLDLSSVANLLADLANVEGIVVTESLSVLVLVGGVFPGIENKMG